MGKNKKIARVWVDKKILFDVPYEVLTLQAEERVLERFPRAEDVKGNRGVEGRLLVSNLRLIWHALTSPQINMTIGLSCIQTVGTVQLGGACACRGGGCVRLVGLHRGKKYEFLFTDLAERRVSLATAASAILRSYNNSRMYRELKLRAALVQDRQLRLLPAEQISVQESGVWNLSSEAGHLGVLLASNVRVVWFATANQAFNVSLPHIVIESISSRASKFGEALVVCTHPECGGYVLGFRVDPPERLHALCQELQTLHQVYSERPLLGVQYERSEQSCSEPVEDTEEFTEIGEPRGEMGAALYSVGGSGGERAPAYSAHLGLAVEALPPGFTLQELFQVQT